MGELVHRVGIHQPNFFPWLGYFLKMAVSDTFIYHDDVEYSKRTLTKRTFIRSSTHIKEPKYLSVSLQRHKNTSLISELVLDSEEGWRKSLKNKIYNSYVNTPFFDHYFEELSDLIDDVEHSSFADFSINILEKIRIKLMIACDTIRSSNIGLNQKGQAYNISLVQRFDGTHYNSGMGAKKYQDSKEFESHGIHLIYLDFSEFLKSYSEKFTDWSPSYSILDAFFYLGEEQIQYILHSFNQFYSKRYLNEI